MTTQTVREFLRDSYRIVSANTPTTGLHGDDLQKGIQILNRLLRSFSATGLLITVPKEVTYNLSADEGVVTFASTGATINEGRLSNMANAWVVLDGTTYPLKDESTNEFFNSYKYAPLAGLPRYVIIQPGNDITTMTIYPKPSQAYELHVYGKFELTELTENDTMAELPEYYDRYLQLVLSRDLALYKSRIAAWTEDHKVMLKEAQDDMESVSPVNLDIISPEENDLNGAWRVRAGV